MKSAKHKFHETVRISLFMVKEPSTLLSHSKDFLNPRFLCMLQKKPSTLQVNRTGYFLTDALITVIEELHVRDITISRYQNTSTHLGAME